MFGVIIQPLVYHFISDPPTGKRAVTKRIVKKASILVCYFICVEKSVNSVYDNAHTQ